MGEMFNCHENKVLIKKQVIFKQNIIFSTCDSDMNMSQTVHEHKCILHADRTDKRTDDRRQRWRRGEERSLN